MTLAVAMTVVAGASDSTQPAPGDAREAGIAGGTELVAKNAARPPIAAAAAAPAAAAPAPAAKAATSWVIAAAGDIACDPTSPAFRGGQGTATQCHMRATAELVRHLRPSIVLTLGDNQYENGTLAKYRQSYDRSWGQLKRRTRPSPGNHEYHTKDAAGYFDYFEAAAGNRSKGYYSFDVGPWHIVSLNSECTHVGGCGRGSPQERWLRADLAAHRARCTLAYWHKPRFSSGPHGSMPEYDAFWRALYDHRADVVLNGHDHDYERFAPQTPRGTADTARGIRQFVVGTGGESHYELRKIKPNSRVRHTGTFGVLKLRLRPSSYDWRFVPEPGKRFTDSGNGRCH